MTIDPKEQFQMLRTMEGPSWRWKLAARLAAGLTGNLADSADDTVRQAASYIELLTAGEEQRGEAESNFPTFAAAKALWDNQESRRQFTILILGDHPRDHIGDRLGVTLEIVECTERLFMDIRETRQAASWIDAHVILSESRSGSDKCAVQYRAAFWGGPHIASSILDVEERVPLDEVQRIADQEILLHMKFRQALAFPLDDAQSNLKFMKMYFECEHRGKQLEMAKERFRHQCEQDIRRHELADRRLAAAALREESRIATSQRRTARVSQMAEETKKYFDGMFQLRQEHHAAEDRLAAERANASPLARLRWPTKAPLPDLSVNQVPQQFVTRIAAGRVEVPIMSAVAAA